MGLIGAVVIGISCIAPAYTLTAAPRPGGFRSGEGFQVPAIIIVGFIPMLLVAFGYREAPLRSMPDSGTSFTWATRVRPWVGWMAGWGANRGDDPRAVQPHAGIAVEFLFLLIDQIAGKRHDRGLAFNPFINVAVCLLFMLRATFVSYRDMQTTQARLVRLDHVSRCSMLVIFSVAAFAHVAKGNRVRRRPVELSWFNLIRGRRLRRGVAGLSLSIFIFWGGMSPSR